MKSLQIIANMHKFLENHITGVGYDDLTGIGQEAKPMAQKIIEKTPRQLLKFIQRRMQSVKNNENH